MTADDAPIRVLLVEDNDVYRESLVFLLKRVTAVDVVGAVADGNAAMRACIELHPDVVVLDYRLPDVDGAEVATGLREHTPGVEVVFLSASAGEDEYDAASSAGAALVRKDEGVDALVSAVRAAAGRRRE
ncbi:MAG TPA: response regulator [Gaiellaceae bacterium]|nr:response regulator [Gaiellaceae bacterium]